MGSQFAVARYNENGSLDTSFHHDGKVLTNFRSTREESILALTIDGQDRILVGGWAADLGQTRARFALARYDDLGNLDPGFHGDGKVLTDFRSTESEKIEELAIDRVGRIVAAGWAWTAD